MRGVGTLFLVTLATATPATAETLPWRFGIEDTWAQLGGLLGPAHREQLAARMAEVTAAQGEGGDVNVNGTAGGWAGMQPTAGATISFVQADELVRFLQGHGFSMLWNLRLNATWASAGNPDCTVRSTHTDCAPDAAHEADLAAYIRALVERYDGDGVADMGMETPADPSDDLVRPIRFYLMTGEIEFAGAVPEPTGGYGDAATNHFWSDSIDNLLRTHRIVHQALHQADPSGSTRLVSSGGVLWDLYTDFPDYPATVGPTVQARLAGANLHGASYVQSFARLRQMLASFGDPTDGTECDLVGWHPHMGWREIPQVFALIREETGGLPIYVDDMWTNLFLLDRADAPGNRQFTAGGLAAEGDFPNPLVPSHAALRTFVLFGGPVRDWYLDRTGRQLVKAFATAFGEGAERVSFSGNADLTLDRFGITAYINLLGTAGEGFPRHPAFFAYRQLVESLHDFSTVEEVAVSADPRTRVYRFDRPRGPLWVAWSESGPPPTGLDYTQATGETVSIPVGTALARVVPVALSEAEPAASTVATDSGTLVLPLGHAPVYVEAIADPCSADTTTLCLGGRFAVRATYRTVPGATGSGQAVSLTADTGLFWFFQPTNVELLVKVLDACATFDRYWVFAAGLTNVEVEWTVTDTTTGAVRTYTNPLATPFLPVQDTQAFAACR